MISIEMNPINEKISENGSQNPEDVMANKDVETTIPSKAADTSINTDIKTNDEIKDMNTVEKKSEDIINKVNCELENEKQVEDKKDENKLSEEVEKSKETISQDNTAEQTSNVKDDRENKKDEKIDEKQSLKENDQIEMDNISKDSAETDENCKLDKGEKFEQIASKENSDLSDSFDKQIKDKNENMEIENESESEKADELDEEYEDVEVPEDEIEELIVPDEADAEDLTSLNGDVLDKSSIEDETTKDSDVDEHDDNETSINEEETTKDSEAAAAGDHDEKESSANDEKINESSLNEEEVEDLTEEIDNLPIEPELIAIEAEEEVAKGNTSMIEDSTNDDDANNEESIHNTTNDPLNCFDNQEEKEDNNENNDNDENLSNLESIVDNEIVTKDMDNHNLTRNDDDEDDVQFVETRNSPICIESDEDDADDKSEQRHNSSINTNPESKKQTITTPTATITVPKNIIVTRTSARKSTAKPPTQQQQQTVKSNNSKSGPQLQNKTKKFSYLEKATTYRRSPAPRSQQIVDCIELLDSTDDESSSASHYRPPANQRTPQKRTLLAAKGSNTKYSNKNENNRGNLPSNFTPQIRKQAKKPAPLPLPPATPQSNFLNAVQLQPAAITGVNPPAFSALLSNKSVIIPNAFYGNHPSVRDTSDIDIDRRYGRWLENFLNQFCNAQLVATHSCFVFLQKSLKYKDFVRIKAIRANMNTHAQATFEQFNKNLMIDLRSLLMKNNRDLTTQGRRFCELTCNTPIQGKAVTLFAHGITGRVTMKTCNMDLVKATQSSSTSTSASSTAANNSLTRKRQLEEDEDEYMPDKQKLKTIAQKKPPSENGDSGETSEDRKRSLRTKRTKRLDNSFSYNEDDLLAEYEIDDEEEAEKMAQAEVQRKIENKRLEAQKQRQQQVKSFESAFIQAFTKCLDGPTSSSSKNSKNASNQRIRLENSLVADTSLEQYTANNDAEDLLQATWIENAENDDTQIISDDDEPKVHRIYKQQQQEQYQQQLQQLQLQQQQQYHPITIKLPTKLSANAMTAAKPSKNYKSQQEEVITGDDDYIENDQFYNNPSNIDRMNWPKNVDVEMHVNGKFKDKCLICNLNCQRIVHHYVNEHRGCEVYNSRLTSSQIQFLRSGNCSESSMSMYKNGQPQYEAYCIFCQKQSRFMLPYWFQHFTMHTGEYAYRCTGCGIRKPTRSLLTQHQAQGCPQIGGIKQDYSHDPKSIQIEARVCKICNYVQLHRSNIVKHLHHQHNVQRILPKHIQTIVLLKTPSSSTSSTPTTNNVNNASNKRRKPSAIYNQASSSSSSPSTHSTYIIEDDDNEFILDQEEPNVYSSSSPPTGDTQNHYYNYIPPYMQAGNAAAAAAANFTWEDNDPAEDLSFMICGMLDVQMNNSD